MTNVRLTGSTKTATAAKVGTLAACVGTVCAAILTVMVPEFESGGKQYLKAYRDQVGVWTICDGDTQGVGPNTVETPAGCQRRLEERLVDHAAPVLDCAPALAGRDNQLAAAVSITYNIGTAGFCRSSIARNINAGDWTAAGESFLAFDKATYRTATPPRGLACTRRADGKGWLCRIPGLTNRRVKERARFMMELPR